MGIEHMISVTAAIKNEITVEIMQRPDIADRKFVCPGDLEPAAGKPLMGKGIFGLRR
nr:hypothetical protein [Sphingomonas sp. CDS-1]